MEAKCILLGTTTGDVFIPVPVREVGPYTCRQVVGLVYKGWRPHFFFVFPCQLRWEFSAEQHWVLWPCHRQLGSSGLHGNSALWCWCVCSPRKVTVIWTPAGASDYSKGQFVGESRILCRMFISHCVHRAITGTSAWWLYLLDAHAPSHW